MWFLLTSPGMILGIQALPIRPELVTPNHRGAVDDSTADQHLHLFFGDRTDASPGVPVPPCSGGSERRAGASVVDIDVCACS